MSAIVVTPPAVEPVSAAEVLQHLNAIENDEILVGRQISAARQHVESVLGRALITQELKGTCSVFPGGALRLPRPPFQEVIEVAYLDRATVLQVLDPSAYRAVMVADVAYLEPTSGSWPITAATIGAVSITWRAGYGDSGSDVPADIRQAVLMLAGHFYENREASFVGNASAHVIPYGVAELLAPHRERAFA